MARLVHVKHARKAIRGTDIKKGDSYYWYKHRNGPKVCSKHKPARSRYATTSEYIGEMMDMEDACGGLPTEVAAKDAVDECVSQLEEWASRVEEMGQECDEKRSNMPEQLQDSGSGELLQTRVEECEALAQAITEAKDAIESIELPEEGDTERSEDDVISEIGEALNAIDWSYS